MLTNIGIPGLVIIVVLALIIFGPKKLPQMGRAVGETIQEFKSSTKNLVGEEIEAVKDINDKINNIKKL